MEKLLFTLVVICLIALVIVVSANFGARFQKSLSEHYLSFNWNYLISILVIISLTMYIIYSMIGIITTSEYKTSNNNICKGYNYGIKICRGDINAE